MMNWIYYCADHRELHAFDAVKHLAIGHVSGSFVVDRAHPNVYYVVDINGMVKKTDYRGVSKVLSDMPSIFRNDYSKGNDDASEDI